MSKFLRFYTLQLLTNVFSVQEQDETKEIINWNNLRDTPITTIQALFRALEYNQYVKEVSICKFVIYLI